MAFETKIGTFKSTYLISKLHHESVVNFSENVLLQKRVIITTKHGVEKLNKINVL